MYANARPEPGFVTTEGRAANLLKFPNFTGTNGGDTRSGDADSFDVVSQQTTAIVLHLEGLRQWRTTTKKGGGTGKSGSHQGGKGGSGTTRAGEEKRESKGR